MSKAILRTTLMFLGCVVMISAWADYYKERQRTATIGDITWRYTEYRGEACVGDHRYSSLTAVPQSTTGAINIPSMLGGYPVTSIESFAFEDCRGLTSVTIPSSVMNIGDAAFSGCSGLMSVTIPEGVTSIGNSVFRYCIGLKSVEIPASVTHVVGESFIYTGLMQINVDVNNPNYTSANGMLLSKDGKKLIAGVNGDVVIPSAVTSIGSFAFGGYLGLTSVTIPSSVTSIDGWAFYCLPDLKTMEIPSSVTNIDRYAFRDCSGLTNVVFCGNAPTVGSQDAFYGVASNCTATVKWGTTGWDDDGDGMWAGLTLKYVDKPIVATAIGYEGVYDGMGHGITLNLKKAVGL